MVPEGWRLDKLDDIAEKIMVGIASAATHAYSERGIRMLRNLNIKDGWIDDSDILYVNEEYERSYRNKRLRTGDILTVRTGYPGVSAVVPSKYEGAQCFTSLITRLNQVKALPDYVCRYINSEYGKKFIVSGEAGGAQKNVNAGMLKRMVIPLPPLNEQRKIAEILSTWDEAITTTERLLANSEQQKKALMQQLLTGKKRLPGFRRQWKSVKLGSLGGFVKGRGIKNDDITYEGVPCIRYGEIYTTYNNFVVNPVSRIPRRVAEQSLPIMTGDLLFTCSGEKLEEIGKCVAYLGEGESYAGGDIIVLRQDGNSPAFLGYLMNYPLVIKQKMRMGQGHSVVHISTRSLAEVEICLPPQDEQDEIAHILLIADREIQALKEHLSYYINEKKALMQQLLSGKRRVDVGSLKAAS